MSLEKVRKIEGREGWLKNEGFWNIFNIKIEELICR
jgi:hypothetical protein